jgi:hypothetical protein
LGDERPDRRRAAEQRDEYARALKTRAESRRVIRSPRRRVRAAWELVINLKTAKAWAVGPAGKPFAGAAGPTLQSFAAGSGYHGGWTQILGADLNRSESRSSLRSLRRLRETARNRLWEFLSLPNCALEVLIHARWYGLVVLISNVFAYHLRIQEAITANAAMPLVAGEDVRTPFGAFRVVFGIGHFNNQPSASASTQS